MIAPARRNDPARHREALSDVLEESDRVLSMLTTLMDISEAETGTMKLNVSQVDVAQLAAEVVALYEDTAEDAGVTLAASVADGLMAPADRDRLRQALANLVDNAIKYTPCSTCSVSASFAASALRSRRQSWRK